VSPSRPRVRSGHDEGRDSSSAMVRVDANGLDANSEEPQCVYQDRRKRWKSTVDGDSFGCSRARSSDVITMSAESVQSVLPTVVDKQAQQTEVELFYYYYEIYTNRFGFESDSNGLSFVRN
jgi:hypothetical protein